MMFPIIVDSSNVAGLQLRVRAMKIGHISSMRASATWAWVAQRPNVTWNLNVVSSGPDLQLEQRWTPTHDVILRANQSPASTRSIVNVVGGQSKRPWLHTAS